MSASTERRSSRWLTRNVLWIGVVSLLTDASSEMIVPLLPAFVVGTLGAGALAVGWIEGGADATASVPPSSSRCPARALHEGRALRGPTSSGFCPRQQPRGRLRWPGGPGCAREGAVISCWSSMRCWPSIFVLFLVVPWVAACSVDRGGLAPSEGGPPDAAVDSGDGGTTSCDGAADCDDGLACNGEERCVDGSCVSGDPIVCDDGVACTADRCVDPAGDCTQSPDDGLCADGEVCHATMGCVIAEECESASDCDDGAACNGEETCDPSSPDADPATGCVDGTPVDCDDGVDCTTDMCLEPDGSCTHAGEDADGDGAVVAGCLDGADCHDGNADVYPGATELCDGVDNDCEAGTADGADESWLGDACDGPDSDMCAEGTLQCAGGGMTCNDTSGDTVEVCNMMDDDCDGSVDEDISTTSETCNAMDDDCDGTVDEDTDCGCHLERRDGHVYLFCSDGRTWLDAQTYCSDRGYDLVTIETEGEDSWLDGIVFGQADEDWWIGYNDRDTEDTFVWVSGSSSSWDDWRSGQPNDYGGQDCGAIQDGDGPSETEARWGDYECDLTKPFVCEAAP